MTSTSENLSLTGVTRPKISTATMSKDFARLIPSILPAKDANGPGLIRTLSPGPYVGIISPLRKGSTAAAPLADDLLHHIHQRVQPLVSLGHLSVSARLRFGLRPRQLLLSRGQGVDLSFVNLGYGEQRVDAVCGAFPPPFPLLIRLCLRPAHLLHVGGELRLLLEDKIHRALPLFFPASRLVSVIFSAHF
jgi:hypothetical protein